MKLKHGCPWNPSSLRAKWVSQLTLAEAQQTVEQTVPDTVDTIPVTAHGLKGEEPHIFGWSALNLLILQLNPHIQSFAADALAEENAISIYKIKKMSNLPAAYF